MLSRYCCISAVPKLARCRAPNLGSQMLFMVHRMSRDMLALLALNSCLISFTTACVNW